MNYNNPYHAVLGEIQEDLKAACDEDLTEWGLDKLSELFTRQGTAETLLNPGSAMQIFRRAELTLLSQTYYSARMNLARWSLPTPEEQHVED